MDLPSELIAPLAGYDVAPCRLGESGATVWYCTAQGLPARYLKVASLGAELRLDEEAERLRWMHDRGVSVPTVLGYDRTGDAEYLLLSEQSGLPASDSVWLPALPEMIDALGQSLVDLHRTSITDCPFDQGVALQIVEARRRIDTKRVATYELDEIRAGHEPEDLFRELLASFPVSEDLVFTHGDFCLPNIILRRGGDGRVEVAGLVDCGRAGVADRYQDIALAIRSIEGNFGEEWVLPFLHAYGLQRADEEKVHFYLLLDEFF
jgi:kanamycin kinase/aminoglycoside 3'-phosphotransferase-2